MGGDDSQKLLPWRGSAPLRGANLRLNYEINNVTETAGWSLLLTPPSLAGLAVASATGRLGHFWKAHPGQFWRAPKTSGNGTVELGQEVASENEAMVESFRVGGSFAVVTEWKAQVDLATGVPVIKKEAVKSEKKVAHS